MNPLTLIEKYYPPGTLAHRVLLRHSKKVATKAVAVARDLATRQQIDVTFVEEAALLHDIGILFTNAPELGCEGDLPYLAHSFKGRELLEADGLPRHALVCDRHIGVGLTAEEIRTQNLPLPARDMLPLSLEEKVITYADLFFSKDPEENDRERPVKVVRQTMARYGQEKVLVFDAWHKMFSP